MQIFLTWIYWIQKQTEKLILEELGARERQNFNVKLRHFCGSNLNAIIIYFQSLVPSWHSDVVTTLSIRCCWRCHNVVAWLKMRLVPTSAFDVTTSLSDVIKALPQRCYNVATTLSTGFLGHFTMDYFDFFSFIETWESYKRARWH